MKNKILSILFVICSILVTVGCMRIINKISKRNELIDLGCNKNNNNPYSYQHQLYKMSKECLQKSFDEKMKHLKTPNLEEKMKHSIKINMLMN